MGGGVDFKLVIHDNNKNKTDDNETNDNNNNNVDNNNKNESIFVQAGTTFKGFVVLTVNEPDGVKGAKLALQFRGTERTSVEYVDSVGGSGQQQDRTYLSRVATSSRNLVTMDIPVQHLSFVQQGHVAMGKYQIPFCVHLPESLPSSFRHFGSTNFNDDCEIKYVLAMELKGSGVLWNYKAEQAVTIRAKPLPAGEDPVPFHAEPVNTKVKSCACLGKGSISLGGMVDDVRLEKGQSCQVSIACRNYSTLPISAVTAKLYQTIIWYAGPSHNRVGMDTQVLAKHNFTTELADSIAKHTQGDPNNNKYAIQSQLSEMFAELSKATHAAQFVLPSEKGGTYSTYSSRLIQIKHVLEIECVTMGMCTTHPMISIPILIGEGNPNKPATKSSSYGSTSHTTASSFSYSPPTYEDAVMATPVIFVSSLDAQTGGVPVAHPENTATGGYSDEDKSSSSAAMIAAPPIVENKNRMPSFQVLLSEMSASIQDWDIVHDKLEDLEWQGVFCDLTPTQFGLLLQQVDLEFDQPKVALAVAVTIPAFTVNHVVAALQASAVSIRTTLVEKLLSHCVDLVQNHALIDDELSEWEQLVTNHARNKALAAATGTDQ